MEEGERGREEGRNECSVGKMGREREGRGNPAAVLRETRI